MELQFTVPTRTTDGQPLREPSITGSLCRQARTGPCVPVDEAQTRAPLPVAVGEPEPVVWTDTLAGSLDAGAPRVIAYRVELRNGAGRTAGYSDPVYALAGTAPPPVSGLRAQGTRAGIELRWTPLQGAGEVLLRRSEPLRPGRAKPTPAPVARGKNANQGRALTPEASHRKAQTPGVVWLEAAPGDRSAGATIDGSVQEGVAYEYVALRRERVTFGGRTLELRSAPSGPVSFAWRDIYPPTVPAGLTAIGFQSPETSYAVDLVWQPVDDARLAGYVVYRQTLNAAGESEGVRVKLTPQPVTTPGFHDATAQPNVRYRYSVTAVDPKGNESAAAETTVEPASTP